MEHNNEKKKNLVVYHRKDAVGFITLNRPEKHNALNRALWNDLDSAIGEAEQDDAARAILVCGKGKSFCSGLELGTDPESQSHFGATPSAAQKVNFFNMLRNTMHIYTRLEHLTKPTIAVIHGHCIGGGLELALCCDFRLCSQDAQFSLPEARMAIITDMGGLVRLPKIVGPGHAREIAFRGHRFDADRALVMHLVNDIYPDKETLEQKAMEIAEEIAENPPLAVQGTKEVFLFNEGISQSKALEYNAARVSMTIPSEDLREAMAAFAQKRKGKYKGA